MAVRRLPALRERTAWALMCAAAFAAGATLTASITVEQFAVATPTALLIALGVATLALTLHRWSAATER